MKRYRGLRLPTALLLAAGLGGVALAQEITSKAMVMDLKQRELQASPAIKTRLEGLRRDITAKKWTFEVGYTAAMDFTIEQITGLRVPDNLATLAKEQNVRALEIMKAFPDVALGGCSARAVAFDWRKANGVTGVRDQGPCGSCWAFATHGAFEGSYRILDGMDIDSSEQDTLDCNPWGYSCGGGWWAFQYLMDKGSATEASYPYTAVKGACKTAIPRVYRAVNWGYVDPAVAIPTVANIKAALCRYGPLAVAVRATGAFQAYTGGVFNESDPGAVNHGVTLIGWDGVKKAWLIKNSWGTGWGETGGFGTDRGYMWISYTSNSIGRAAAWTRAIPRQDCVGFNPATTTVQKVGTSWKVVDGSHWMFDFGANKAEADQTLRIIKFYKMNRSCFVGRPDPSFTYMLVADAAPAGALAREDCIAFNPASIEVKEVSGSFRIVQGTMSMYDFGALKEEAYEALGIIKKYGFTQQCFVGRPDPSFHYLRK